MGSVITSLLNSTGALNSYGRVFATIQNNIANANTPGYAKQEQSLLAAEGPAGGLLLGPLIDSRSQYLEQAVRTQQAKLGAASQRSSDLSQIESQFSLSGASGVPATLNDFFNSFSQLSVNPNDPVSRQNVLVAAGGVARAFQQNASGISQLSVNVDSQTRGQVDTVNQIAAQLSKINETYRATSGQHDPGLDAQANAALEQLAQVVNFSVVKSPEGGVNVYIGGQTPLVVGAHKFPVSADFSGQLTAIRDSEGKDITGELQDQGGSLGSLLEEKNNSLPSYTTSLNTLAQGFADSVNTTLAQGLDRNGNVPTSNLFGYNPAQGAAYTLQVNNLTPDQIAAAVPGAPNGNGNALNLANLAKQSLVGGFTFTQSYGNLAATAGRDVANAKQDHSAQQDLVAQAQQQRAQVSGVSLNEEAARLIQFQQSYQAVGKFVNVLKTLTDTLLTIIQ